MKFYKILKQNHILSLFLGAHFIISSTLIINSAASEADIKDYSFDLKLSVTPNFYISPTVPSFISKPALKFPF